MDNPAQNRRLRRRLLAGGAGFLAGAGLGTAGRAALAQTAMTTLPFANGTRRNWKRPSRSSTKA